MGLKLFNLDCSAWTHLAKFCMSIVPLHPFHVDFPLYPLPMASFHFDTSEYVTDTEWPFSLLHVVSRMYVFFHIWEWHSMQVIHSRVPVGVQKLVHCDC